MCPTGAATAIPRPLWQGWSCQTIWQNRLIHNDSLDAAMVLWYEIPRDTYSILQQCVTMTNHCVKMSPHLSVTHLGNRCSCCCFWSDNYTRKKKQELKARPRLGLTRNLTPQSINCRSPQNFQYDLQQPQCKLHDSSNRSQQRLHCGLKRGFQICQLPL